MSDIIDLQQRRDERDCEICHVDPVTGERWYKYALSYDFGGSEFCLDAWAKSDAEAEANLIAAIRSTLRIEGRVYAERDN